MIFCWDLNFRTKRKEYHNFSRTFLRYYDAVGNFLPIVSPGGGLVTQSSPGARKYLDRVAVIMMMMMMTMTLMAMLMTMTMALTMALMIINMRNDQIL